MTQNAPAHDTAAHLPFAALAAVYNTVRQLADPGGCAWHAAQSHASLIPFLIEESAEFIDALEREQSPAILAEELGDVLYQVFFHAAIAERDREGYDLAIVAERLNEKLIARHPHVFGDRGYMSVEELHAEWERLKEDAAGQARGSRDPLAGIPAGMPTLAKASKVVERLKRAQLLDPQAELNTRNGGAAPRTEEELGDAILALVIAANAERLDPDRALRLALNRFAAAQTTAAQVGVSAVEE